MEIELVKAVETDAEEILHAQIESFTELLERCQDTDTNPANETVDRVLARINRPDGAFYKVMLDDRLAGAICIYWTDEGHFWISPMFIKPFFQGKKVAQQVICQVEQLYPEAVSWELATILEEEKNCYLYEKAGYMKTGVTRRLNNHATLVYYKKPL